MAGGSQYHDLQSFATAILRQLVTKSAGAASDGDSRHTRKQARSLQQQMLVTIANALFTDEGYALVGAEAASRRDSAASTTTQPLRTATVVAHLSDEPRASHDESISLILHFRVLGRNGKRLREFRHRGKLRSDRPTVSRTVILEQEAEVVSCDVVIGVSDTSTSADTKPKVHGLRISEGPSAQGDVADAVAATPSGVGRIHLHATCTVSTIDHQGRGVLGRLLGDPAVSSTLVADALAIVSELGKNQEIFCRSDVGLHRHILAVMEATKRVQGRVDLAPLNALTAWFWGNRNSVANFRASWEPLLQLVQLMRTSSLMESSPLSIEPVHVIAATSGPTFLLSLMEWLATLESDSLTENCINVLFFESVDTLLGLASHFFPSRSVRASFFHLVAAVVRVNSLHCEVFARKHAVEMLTAMVEADAGESRAEMLQHAARVVAKIARSDRAADKFVRHQGLELFGRIAYLVFCESPWNAAAFHSRAAADNVVLACAFLCESAASGITIVQSTESQKLLATKFVARSSRRQLSIVEALLLFLTRSGPTKKSTAVPTSFERLAAVIVRVWVEKWPTDSFDFEGKLLQAVEATAREGKRADVASLASRYASGLRRCIELTEWDYLSELNTVRGSYSAAISAASRTGVIPLTCRTPFIPLDKEVLSEWRQLVVEPSQPKREAVANRLRDVLDLVCNHPEIVRTLEVIRKRQQMGRIKPADVSARVAVAVHGVLVVVYDSYVDALASPAVATEIDAAKAASTVLAWLMLLEQICTLLCCAFEAHDPAYYAESFRQLHGLLANELPNFLLKTERVLPREEAVRMQLTNLERQLRQLTSKHELRGVTSEGEDVVQKAESLLVEFSQSKRRVSAALALALASRDAVERVRRGVVAAEYVWRRAFGDSNDTVAGFMAGTKESESLWAKIRSYGQAFKSVVLHPGPILVARWEKISKLLASLLHLLDSKADEQPPTQSAESAEDDYIYDNERETDEEKLAREEDAKLFGRLELRASSELLMSRVPFTSLESLLDHYGFAALGFKKQISLLNFSELRSRVMLAFKMAIEVKRKSGDTPVVEGMSASQLERELTYLQGVALRGEPADAAAFARLCELLHDLQAIVDESDLGVRLRVVVPRPMQVSLWQLVLAPVRRARLYSAYQQLEQLRTTSRPTLEAILRERRALLLDRAALAASPTKTRSKSKILSDSVAWLSEVHSSRLRSKRRAAVAVDAAHDDPFVRLVSTDTDAIVNNPRVLDDPFSDESLVASLKRLLREERDRQASWVVEWCRGLLPSSRRYAVSAKTSLRLRRVKRRLALVALLLAFWRQEELENDLTNEVLARAFSSQAEREDYFLRLHLAKARAELIRVSMPESGSLGLSLWQWPSYFIGGTLLCVAMSCVGPYVLPADAAARNVAMTYATYALALLVFGLSARSMRNITQKHFVLQERNRLRLEPVGKYYQNAQALVTILVEIVQLNSITFDPKFSWNDTDQIPKLIQWLGALGISQIGIAQVELKAALCAAALVVWLVMLKCANKFQESSPFLNRLFTKDLPSMLNGTLYMGFLSTFFSFLSCVDCDGAYGDKFDKCKDSPRPPPFLLSHQSIACWTREHAPYAMLGLWGVTFFLPIGILAQGMNQVLFQQEEVDVKYAPVVLLFTQLIKALAATARAFFTFDTTLLAAVALAGNALLFGIMTLRPSKTKGASLWYIQFIKSGIYAASGWSAACAIYRVETKASSSISNNLVYLGWLAIGGVTAVAIRLEARRRDEQRELEDAAHTGSQRSLSVSSPSDPAVELTSVERKFLHDAVHVTAKAGQVEQLLERAAKYAEEEPPELRAFMQRARAFAASPSSGPATVTEAVFMHNARKLARKIDHNARRRGEVGTAKAKAE